MNWNKNNGRPLITYAEEVQCANWHPLVLMLAEPSVRRPKQTIDAVEAEDFLARLYVSQSA